MFEYHETIVFFFYFCALSRIKFDFNAGVFFVSSLSKLIYNTTTQKRFHGITRVTAHNMDLQYVHTIATNGHWPGGEEQTQPLRINLTNAVNSLIHLFLTVWHWLPAFYLK